jgi:hypothetical protein
MAALINDAIGGHGHDLDWVRTREFQAAPGGMVVRIARYPHAIEPELPGEGNQQANRAGGVAVSTMGGMHIEADAAGVAFDVRRRCNSKVDVTEFLAGFYRPSESNTQARGALDAGRTRRESE